MRKSDLLRAIYAELRASLSREVPAGEVVRLANLILRSYTGLEEVNDDGRVGVSRSLVSLAVDVAMQDGGWRVLDFEESHCSLADSDDIQNETYRSVLQTYLGPEWKHPSLARLP